MSKRFRDRPRTGRRLSLWSVGVWLAVAAASSGCTVYQSIGKSTGAYLHPVSGPDFVHIPNDQWNPSNALLYFYRTDSQWAADEIESPSVYIDDVHYFNIRNDSYTWLEVSPGERHIAMRRPLLGLEGLNSFSLSLIADATLTVEPGHIYYLRYNELSEPDEVNPSLDPDDPLAHGDLQLVTRDYAMQADELVSTRFLNSDMLAPNHAGTSIVRANQDEDYVARKAALEQAREEELARLEAEGKLDTGPWYWPFGSADVELESDRKLEALERQYAGIEAQREKEDAAGGDGWWPF
ncbi:DUF2846 domain-containing protein [Marinobacter sp. C2H3]|uniref:DUF2846 domain-containing protein n=1 Tax=Marinobacter sp. C2H3 TaxID=3119003 RepID=UPI00300F42A9